MIQCLAYVFTAIFKPRAKLIAENLRRANSCLWHSSEKFPSPFNSVALSQYCHSANVIQRDVT